MAEAGEARPRGDGVCRPGAKAKPPSTVKPPPGEKARPPPPGDAPLIEERACFASGRGSPRSVTTQTSGVAARARTGRCTTLCRHKLRSATPHTRSEAVRAPRCCRRRAPRLAHAGRDGDARVSLYRLAAAGCFDAAAVPDAPGVVRAAADQESDRERGQVRRAAVARPRAGCCGALGAYRARARLLHT